MYRMLIPTAPVSSVTASSQSADHKTAATERVPRLLHWAGRRVRDGAFANVLRHPKKQDIVENIVERVSAVWRLLNGAAAFDKREARAAVMSALSTPVDASDESTLTYRAPVRY